MYARLGVPEARLEEANARWWAALDATETALFPGVRDALERLAATGYPLGIVTAGRSDRVGAELRRHGIERAVRSGRLRRRRRAPEARSGTPRGRPLAGLGRDAAGSVYVGDTPDDMRMAVAAGVRAVGIESVLGDAAELRAAGADETASTTVGWVETRLGRAVHAATDGPRR